MERLLVLAVDMARPWTYWLAPLLLSARWSCWSGSPSGITERWRCPITGGRSMRRSSDAAQASPIRVHTSFTRTARLPDRLTDARDEKDTAALETLHPAPETRSPCRGEARVPRRRSPMRTDRRIFPLLPPPSTRRPARGAAHHVHADRQRRITAVGRGELRQTGTSVRSTHFSLQKQQGGVLTLSSI
jgi:hypothetical protein